MKESSRLKSLPTHKGLTSLFMQLWVLFTIPVGGGTRGFTMYSVNIYISWYTNEQFITTNIVINPLRHAPMSIMNDSSGCVHNAVKYKKC